MKIIRLTTLLDFGGQEKQYISFTDQPELLQHEYIFAAIGHGGHAEDILNQRGFKTKIFNLPVGVKNLKNIWILRNWIKSIKPDIVHTAAAEANFHGILAAKLAGVPVIIGEEIGLPRHSNLAKITYRWVYGFADNLIGVSQSVSDELIKMEEIPASKAVTIYNPVSVPKFFRKKDNEIFNWIYVGRLSGVKNVDTLIKAFKHLNHPTKGVLNIVGEGDQRVSLEDLAGNDKNIVFHGFHSEPEKFVSQADVFVLPSYTEGFGIAAVEAMFQQVPCLCSNVGGIPEFIQDNKNGWLFDPNDISMLIRKMEQILQLSPDEISQMGLRAYQDVIDKFTVEKYIRNLEGFYENMVN